LEEINKMRTGFKMCQAAATFAAMAILAGGLASSVAFGDGAENRGNVLFTQSDRVTAFNPNTGAGQQVGTVTGKIAGTSIVNFQFIPDADFIHNFKITFVNIVVLTDLDGDQIKFINQGSGRFIGPIDPGVFGTGGPLTGTYQALDGTGKYRSWIGKKFPYRAVASNSPTALGTVYVEVYSNPI
jgi:hypothetical protein